MPLKTFTEGIGTHKNSELNDALYTVYGELSADVHSEFQKEAEAIVSTMLNRLKSIESARQVFLNEQRNLDSAKKEHEDTRKESERIGKTPSSFKSGLKQAHPNWTADQVNGEYAKQFKAAQDRYKTALNALSKAQTSLQRAKDKKTAAESYVSSSARSRDRITLTDVCTAPAPGGAFQYMGYSVGKKKYKDFDSLNKPDQERNQRRWDAGYLAIASLVKNPARCQPFIEFRSNRNGQRALDKKETRIGGNDFW